MWDTHRHVSVAGEGSGWAADSVSLSIPSSGWGGFGYHFCSFPFPGPVLWIPNPSIPRQFSE